MIGPTISFYKPWARPETEYVPIGISATGPASIGCLGGTSTDTSSVALSESGQKYIETPSNVPHQVTQWFVQPYL